MAQPHSEQWNCSTIPFAWNGIICRLDERRKGQMCERNLVAIQTSAGACSHAATRISNKIPSINAPKPRSMTSLIKSAFSKVFTTHKTTSQGIGGRFSRECPKERGRPLLPGLLRPRQARPSPLWVAMQATGTTLSRYMQCVNGSTVLEDRQ
jgi:hypothetical protein